MSAACGRADAVLAARLCGIDPGLGGILLIGDHDDARDVIVATLRRSLGDTVPIRRIPANVDEDRLLGGIDLGAALAGDGLRPRRGLLAEADGGLVVVPAADRLPPAAEALIGTALDCGEIATAREGMEATAPASFVVLAFDRERDAAGPAGALGERLAFHIRAVQADVAAAGGDDRPLDDADVLGTIVEMAAALGVDSARASHFTLRAARALARDAGRDLPCQSDVIRAVELVLVPRATRVPPSDGGASSDVQRSDRPEEDGASEARENALEDRVLAAVRAVIDPDLLRQTDVPRRPARGAGRHARGSGERRRGGMRGRPVGVRAGSPRGGARLALVETLRAAAPWQQLRGRDGRVLIHASDLHVRRYETRATLVTIFLVDASGSAAAARLAEAKGAVELLLAQAYTQRAEAALIAFRGVGADVLLPPTRSLTRARRALADLPGGGGTPLASGISAGHAVALATKAKGSTPFLVVLSDGRANVAADGSGGRSAAERDALQAARLVAAQGIASVFIDIAPRPRPDGGRVAAAMGARYLPLPFADAQAVQQAVSALAPGRG